MTMKTRYSLIILLNAAGLALFLSWYLPVNHGFWFIIDSGIFHFFNQKLVESHAFLWWVAITNNRAFDGCSLLAMGGLMLSFWLKEDASGRRRIVIIGLVMLLTAVVLNQLGQALIPVKRASPTLSFEHIYRVSELLHIPTKDASKDSFQRSRYDAADIFRLYAALFRQKGGDYRPYYICGFAFPRVMIGAHWFTDIVVGSLTVILIGLPVADDPLSDRAIALFENYLPGGNKQILNK